MRFLAVAGISGSRQDPDDGKEVRVEEMILRRSQRDGDVIRKPEGGRCDNVAWR